MEWYDMICLSAFFFFFFGYDNETNFDEMNFVDNDNVDSSGGDKIEFERA